MPSNAEPQLTPQDCPAYILAGGQSSRFGSDKALVSVGGEPLVQRLVRQLTAAGHGVQVVADRSTRYAPLGFSCLVDRPAVGSRAGARQGPMAGLATALEHRLHTGPGWLLLIHCDLLQWFPSWFAELGARLQTDSEALTFLTRPSDSAERGFSAEKTFPQPLPGLYHTQLQARVLERLAADDRSLRGLLAVSKWTGLTPSCDPRTWSFNTPAELAQLRERLAAKLGE